MVEQFDLEYPPAGETRRLHLYIPDEYWQSEERYPVTYFFDGQNLFFDGWATFGTCWGLKDFLDGWPKRSIVVGIECSHTNDGRLDEYGPYPMRIAGHEVEPLGGKTLRWVAEDVKPHIDAKLRTWSHREATAIAGSSMGGLMALVGVLRHNDVFSKAACLSPSILPCAKDVRRELEDASIDADTRVWMSWGEKEAGKRGKAADPVTGTRIGRICNKLSEGIAAAGARSVLYCQPEGEHSEASWAEQVPRFMNWLWCDQDPVGEGIRLVPEPDHAASDEPAGPACDDTNDPVRSEGEA